VLPDPCEPIEPCCDCLYTTVRALVAAAADAVEECIGDACPEFGRYVSIAEPQNFGDFVAGWTGPKTPIASRATTPGAKQFFVPKMVTTINIRLVEEGFPTLKAVGGGIMKPDFEALDYAALHFYSHAEVAHRAMLNVMRPACARGCETIQFVSDEAAVPQSKWVAWNWQFRATLNL